MELRYRFILLMIIPATLIGCDDPITTEIIEYGIYEYKGEVINQKNPATFSTNIIIPKGLPVLVKKTNQIPLILGTIFRFCFIAKNLPEENGMTGLHLKLEYPEMTKPDGSKSNGFEFIQKNEVIDGVISTCNGYILNKPYELVPGQWRFTYSYNNVKLIEQEFHTHEL